MDEKKFQEILGLQGRPIVKSVTTGVLFILAGCDWANEMDVELDSGEIVSEPDDIHYWGLFTPVDWKSESGPSGWVYDSEIPEDVLGEMQKTNHFTKYEISDLKYLRQTHNQ